MMTPIRTSIGALAIAATALAGLPGAVAPAAAESENVTIYHSDGRVSHCGPNRGCSRVQRAHPRQWQGQRYKHGRRVYRHRGNDDAAAVILGLTGLAIVGGAIASQNRTLPHTADPAYRHRSPRAGGHYPPSPRSPNVITYDSALEPWSPGWHRWCDARYRSFNPNTGTYRGYDGRDHFCVPR